MIDTFLQIAKIQTESCSEEELKALAYLCKYGRLSYWNSYSIDLPNMKRVLRRLEQKRLLRQLSTSFDDLFEIEPKAYLPLALYFAHEKSIESISRDERIDKQHYLWHLVNLILNPDDKIHKHAANERLNLRSGTRNVYPKIEIYFTPIAYCPELLLPILPYLKPDDIHKIISLQFDCIANEYKITDSSERDFRLAIESLKKGCKARTDLLDKLNYLVFLQSGKVSSPSGKKHSLYSLASLAIKELYEGKTEQANSHFREAIDACNKSELEDGCPKDYIIAYYSILAARMCGDSKSSAYLGQFGTYPLNMFADLLGKDVEEEIHEYKKYTGYQEGISYIIELLTFLHQGTTLPSIDATRCGTLCNALQHELSPWSDKKELSELGIKSHEETFGGSSIISRISRKPEWMVYMEGLNVLAQSEEKSTKKDDRKLRIGYFITSNDRVEVRQQVRLKSGAWSAGRSMYTYTFLRGCEGMDSIDEKIADGISDHYNNLPISKVLPHLIGTDRVYAGTRAPYSEVNIVEALPYIEVKSTKSGGFKISSNITLKMLNNQDWSSPAFSGGVVLKKSECLYEIVKINEIQRNILLKLCERSELPSQSEGLLLKTLSALSPLIEIHSDLLEGGSSLESIQGNSNIVIRLSPLRADNVKAEIMVKPLEGARQCIPGKGDKNLYETIDGKRVMIIRSLADEKAGYQQLLDLLQDQLDCEVDDEQCVLNYEQMLELLDWGRDHQDTHIIEWKEGKKIKVSNRLDSKSVSLRVSSGEAWFTVEGKVRIDQNNISLMQLLELLNSDGNRGRFIRINDEEYVSLSQKLRKHLDRIAASSQKQKSNLLMSQYNVGILADLLNDEAIDARSDADIQSKLALVDEASSLEPQVPPTLNANLREYQIKGFQWMCRLAHWGGGACLADDMGLGKTLQAIAFMLYRAEQGASLVVAPSSVIFNWVNELSRFAPTLSVRVLNFAQSREEMLSDLHNGDIVLTTYGILAQEVEMLQKVNWNVICLDEAHTIKNRQTKMSAAAMSLHSLSRIILTGTPIQNYLGELWNLFQFLNPGLLGTYEVFYSKYIAKSNPDIVSLRKMLSPFILRRTKKEVLSELPDKTEMVRLVQLDDAEMAYYESMRQRVEKELTSNTKVSVNLLAEITKLRQAACSLSLVNKEWEGVSSKTRCFVEVLENIIFGGNSVLVFSQFTSYLAQICSSLDQSGIKYLYLDGSTATKKRKELVDRFQNGECNVFIISLKAGGLGLNLTRANYVLHLDPWWNPAIEQQATDRSYRIGQKENVTVYKFISAHTIEEKILRLHKTKRTLAETFLEGHSQAKSLSLEELRALVEKSQEGGE